MIFRHKSYTEKLEIKTLVLQVFFQSLLVKNCVLEQLALNRNEASMS